MKKQENRLSNAQMMVNETSTNLGLFEISACKCQRCNNVKIEEEYLSEKEIEMMFEDTLN